MDRQRAAEIVRILIADLSARMNARHLALSMHPDVEELWIKIVMSGALVPTDRLTLH